MNEGKNLPSEANIQAWGIEWRVFETFMAEIFELVPTLKNRMIDNERTRHDTWNANALVKSKKL